MGGWFKGVETAQGSERGNYLEDGTYDVEVLYTDSFEKRSGGGALCKARVKILASNRSGIAIADERDVCFNVDPHRKDVIQLQLADVRSFVSAAESVPPAQVTEEVLEYVFKRSNGALVNKKMRIVAETIKVGKAKDQDFTKFKCYPWDETKHVELKGMTRSA